MRIILAYITILLTAFAAFSLDRVDAVEVLFRVGDGRLDLSFADNRQRLQAFEADLHRVIEANALDSLVIKAFTSPDGVSVANMKLSELRCQAIEDHLIDAVGIDRNLIRSYPEGEAWAQLRNLVEATPDVPRRGEVLDILTNVPVWIRGAGGGITDGRKKRLMDLAGGEPYRWMQQNIFPQLRKGVAVAFYVNPDAEIQPVGKDVVRDSEMREDVEFPEVAADTLTLREPRPFRMAVRTNMLYDAALVPNIGVEFGIGRSLSAYGEWMYAWWDNNRRHRFWRVYGGDLGLRWWFGRKRDKRPFSGHHLGVYGGILTFDFELGEYGYMGGKPKGTLWDRYMVNAGIEYGFSLPVAKRLNIDFSIGLGYLGGKYIKYYPFDNDYYFDKEYNMHYFGPTKAEISLVWLIGRGNVNKRKGGEE